MKNFLSTQHALDSILFKLRFLKNYDNGKAWGKEPVEMPVQGSPDYSTVFRTEVKN